MDIPIQGGRRKFGLPRTLDRGSHLRQVEETLIAVVSHVPLRDLLFNYKRLVSTTSKPCLPFGVKRPPFAGKLTRRPTLPAPLALEIDGRKGDLGAPILGERP